MGSSNFFRDVFPPDGSDLVDHDLRFGPEAIFAAGRDRHTKQRCVHQVRRNGADDDAGVSRIKEVGLHHQGGARLAEVAGAGTDHHVAARYFQPAVSARFRQNFSSSVTTPLATSDWRRASAARASCPPDPDNPPRRG